MFSDEDKRAERADDICRFIAQLLLIYELIKLSDNMRTSQLHLLKSLLDYSLGRFR